MKPILLILILGLAFSSKAQEYQNKTALVIGNTNYQVGKLRNPVNDARALSETLKKLGFDVITKYDLNRVGLRDAIREYGNLIREKKGVALFYYSGHGLQSGGSNYLVPVDADIHEEWEIADQCVSADQVLRMLNTVQNPFNIIILDACRNNPYESRYRSGSGGLALPVETPTGSIIAFSTAPGRTASDGDGEYGLYTQELIKSINTPGLSIEEVLKMTRRNVTIISNQKQIPWENSSLLGDFYFIPAQESNNHNFQIKDYSTSYNSSFVRDKEFFAAIETILDRIETPIETPYFETAVNSYYIWTVFYQWLANFDVVPENVKSISISTISMGMKVPENKTLKLYFSKEGDLISEEKFSNNVMTSSEEIYFDNEELLTKTIQISYKSKESNSQTVRLERGDSILYSSSGLFEETPGVLNVFQYKNYSIMDIDNSLSIHFVSKSNDTTYLEKYGLVKKKHIKTKKLEKSKWKIWNKVVTNKHGRIQESESHGYRYEYDYDSNDLLLGITKYRMNIMVQTTTIQRGNKDEIIKIVNRFFDGEGKELDKKRVETYSYEYY